MNKLLLITQREFLNRAKSKSFIIITLLMPFLIAAIYIAPLALSQIKTSETKTVGLADQTGLYLQDFADTGEFKFVECSADDFASQLTAKIIISDTLSVNSKAIKISYTGEPDIALNKYVESLLNARIYRDKLESFGNPEIYSMMNRLRDRIELQTVKVDESGEEHATNSMANMIAGMLLTTMIFMFVIIYGNMVMQSVLEEKTSRIVEIMVSSVKPFQLMLGKIMGIFLLGLLQIGFWISMYLLIVAAISAAVGDNSHARGILDSISATIQALPLAEMAVMFIAFFIGGYLLFASIFAAVGSSVNSQEEAQQFYTPLVLITGFGFYAGVYSVENTSGPLAFWGSMFPITSPMVMMVRIPFGVPVWQEITSLGILYLSALGMLWLAAKIYRIGILMYGKKPTLKEILKWINFK